MSVCLGVMLVRLLKTARRSSRGSSSQRRDQRWACCSSRDAIPSRVASMMSQIPARHRLGMVLTGLKRMHRIAFRSIPSSLWRCCAQSGAVLSVNDPLGIISSGIVASSTVESGIVSSAGSAWSSAICTKRCCCERSSSAALVPGSSGFGSSVIVGVVRLLFCHVGLELHKLPKAVRQCRTWCDHLMLTRAAGSVGTDASQISQRRLLQPRGVLPGQRCARTPFVRPPHVAHLGMASLSLSRRIGSWALPPRALCTGSSTGGGGSGGAGHWFVPGNGGTVGAGGNEVANCKTSAQSGGPPKICKRISWALLGI